MASYNYGLNTLEMRAGSCEIQTLSLLHGHIVISPAYMKLHINTK